MGINLDIDKFILLLYHKAGIDDKVRAYHKLFPGRPLVKMLDDLYRCYL